TADPYVGMSALFNTDWSLTAVGNLYAGYEEIPRDWAGTQIGNPSILGSAGFLQDRGTWTVGGNGADIAGTAGPVPLVGGKFPGRRQHRGPGYGWAGHRPVGQGGRDVPRQHRPQRRFRRRDGHAGQLPPLLADAVHLGAAPWASARRRRRPRSGRLHHPKNS